MNPEIKLASDIIICARKALFDKCEVQFKQSGKQDILFRFLSKSIFRKSVIANSVNEWYNISTERGLKDVKIFVPINEDQKHLLGFANTSNCCILCFWNNGKVTRFTSNWQFDQVNQKWEITYTEQNLCQNLLKDTKFTSEVEEFKDILFKLEEFAKVIDNQYFAEVFHKAYDVLSDSKENSQTQLPNGFTSIYEAINVADVFGAMGSWNDTPAYIAEEKGLKDQYDVLSTELLEQLHINLMYVVNECWTIN